MNTIHRQNKIITRYLYMAKSWCAFRDGDDIQHRGIGRTEAEALADLARLDSEWAEAMDRGEP